MKGVDFVIRKVAIELGIPEDQAKVVYMEYWDNIYNRLISGKNSAVTIRHVGTIAISRYKLNISIRKMIRSIRLIRITEKLTDEKKKELIENLYVKLTKHLKYRNEIAIQYAQNFGNI